MEIRRSNYLQNRFPQLKTYIDIIAAIHYCFRLPVQQSCEVERSMMENLVQQEVESHM